MTDLGRRATDVGMELSTGKPNLLKKHTAIVHCSNTMTLLQRKISNALLYHAYDNLLKQEEHQIRVGELCKLIGYRGRNYDAIKDALRGLISTIIEWNLIDEKTNMDSWTASSILASVNLKSAMCTYSYSPPMKQLLHMPAMFAKINLFVQSHFRSSYGLALYENCIRYQGMEATRWFDTELFRKIMGVPDDVYTVFRDFKKRVLDKAIYEVNTFSNIFIEVEIQRKGWQVVRLRFLLKEREKKKILGKKNVDASVNQDLKTQLKEIYQIHPKTVKRILTDYPEDFIREKITTIESSSGFKKGQVENLAGLLIDALKENYQVASPQSVVQKSSQKSFDEQAQRKKIAALENDYQKVSNKKAFEIFLNSPQHAEILNLFLQKIANTLYEPLFQKDGLSNLLIQDQICLCMRQNFAHELSSLPSLQDYLSVKLLEEAET